MFDCSTKTLSAKRNNDVVVAALMGAQYGKSSCKRPDPFCLLLEVKSPPLIRYVLRYRAPTHCLCNTFTFHIPAETEGFCASLSVFKGTSTSQQPNPPRSSSRPIPFPVDPRMSGNNLGQGFSPLTLTSYILSRSIAMLRDTIDQRSSTRLSWNSI